MLYAYNYMHLAYIFKNYLALCPYSAKNLFNLFSFRITEDNGNQFFKDAFLHCCLSIEIDDFKIQA